VQRRLASLAAPLLAFALLAAACGDDSKPASAADGTPSAEAATGAPDLSGVTLRVADQSRSVELPLVASGELAKAPYKVTFASFANGPAVNEALRGGDVDLGFMGDVPALGAAVGGLEVKVVGVISSTGPGSILVARAGSGIKTLKELKGRKVAYTTGTAQQGFALRALGAVGLQQKDVQQIDVPLQDLPSVLESGDADASVISVEARVKYVAAHPDAVTLATAKELKPYVGSFFLARNQALGDTAKRAAIEDFLARRVRAYTWVAANQDTWANTYYVQERKQKPEDAKVIAKETGVSQFVPITKEIRKAHQDLADLLRSAGALPVKVDASVLYDDDVVADFNQIVNKELPK
jgi:sulfonate transport system substrate-binding protein